MKKVFILLAAFLAYAIGIGLYFANKVMFMKKKEVDVVLEREQKAGRFNLDDFQALPQEEVWIESPHGYRLHTLFIEPYPQSDRWMIFCHGITENKFSSVRYMNLFIKRGYNAVIYDHRRHGSSEGLSSTYGHYEKNDLYHVIAQLKKRKGSEITLGIHGESMGAVTLLLYAGLVEDGANFYIADCPFSTFSEQLAYRIKQDYGLPKWLILPFGEFWVKRQDGYAFKDVSPLKAVKNIDNPILFIHSLGDNYIPPQMSETLYAAKSGAKQLFLAPKGNHAQSYNLNPEAYEEAIDTFLQKYAPNHNDIGPLHFSI